MADLEKHLRDILDAAEPSVRLAGPAAARARRGAGRPGGRRPLPCRPLSLRRPW
ncbi:hypothetical protein [Streptomyces coeruleoprunus]|uniref:hypothetical protein n=1 Tax=Streptomyces coeruleoprunus TaxID=285563 RepID=UPI0031E57274